MTVTSSRDEELNRVQILLEARATELERGIHQREAIAIEQSPDQLDEIQTASDRDLAISKIDRQSKELRDVRAALRRIHDGRFGVCEQCEEDIAPRRLAAIPWASLCIVCQEAEEHSLLETRTSADSLMSDARVTGMRAVHVEHRSSTLIEVLSLLIAEPVGVSILFHAHASTDFVLDLGCQNCIIRPRRYFRWFLRHSEIA